MILNVTPWNHGEVGMATKTEASSGATRHSRSNEDLLTAAKMLADDLHHYRNREVTGVVSFATFCLLVANAAFTHSGQLDSVLGWSGLVSLAGVTVWVWRILSITRQRGALVKKARDLILLSIALPPEARAALELKARQDGLTAAWRAGSSLTVILALIVLFIAFLPGILLVHKMG